MSKIVLNDDEKQFIRNHKDLIDDGDWDGFFDKCCSELFWEDASDIYQFLYFEAGINLLHKMSYVPRAAFWSTPYNLGDLVIPSNIKRLNVTSFANINHLTSVDLSRTDITEIPKGCLGSNYELNDVTLPKTCSWIKENAFFGCYSLQHINLENICHIDVHSFYHCENLKTMDLRNASSADDIRRAINDCESLTTLIIPNKYLKEFKDNTPGVKIRGV